MLGGGDREPGEHCVGVRRRVLDAQSPGSVHERQLVRVDIEVRQGGVRRGRRRRRLEQLALRTHRHELPRTHRERTREEAREPGQQHGARRHAGRADAEHEREVRHEPVVRTEHRGAERARQPVPAPGGQRAHHFLVDLLVRGHRHRGIGVVRVRRPGLGALRERQHEHAAEAAREEPERARAQVPADGGADVGPQEIEPVRLVPLLRAREREQDLALLTGTPSGEVAIDRRLGSLVREQPAPPPDVGAGPTAGRVQLLRALGGRGSAGRRSSGRVGR